MADLEKILQQLIEQNEELEVNEVTVDPVLRARGLHGQRRVTGSA